MVICQYEDSLEICKESKYKEQMMCCNYLLLLNMPCMQSIIQSCFCKIASCCTTQRNEEKKADGWMDYGQPHSFSFLCFDYFLLLVFFKPHSFHHSIFHRLFSSPHCLLCKVKTPSVILPDEKWQRQRLKVSNEKRKHQWLFVSTRIHWRYVRRVNTKSK